ncbi:MAG: S41 family peptidase [Rickettsiaceae bacterium]|nr:S41 family peptidase [Rickettsiaceae bacterium]
MLNKAIILQIILLLCGTNIVLASTETPKEEQQPNSYYYKQFQEVFQRIEKDYMQDPKRQEMTDEAINGMLHSLDPYSSYYTGEDLAFFLDQTDGEFGGIGVEIIYDSGAVKIITPIDDLPAYKAGIGSGDYIIGVNGQLVSNMGFNKSVQEMRGKPGSSVNLLVIKEGEHAPKEIDLKREIVKIKPIKFEIEEEEFGGVAYIRIVAFNNQTSKNLKKAVADIEKKLKEKNKELKGIVLDVRNNPGGLLDQAVEVSEYFIDHGVIVSTKGRDDKNNTIISSGRFTKKAPKVPIVVLINSGTASAAEIVAGALQDHNRAIIVGTTSFGKGLVQTFTQINNRAAVKLTTAKYYTPSGKSINAKGIQPDILIENAKVEYAEEEKKDTSFSSSSIKSYLKKYNTEEKAEDMLKKDEEKPSKTMSEKYKNDYQYARAYDLIRGLIISREEK